MKQLLALTLVLISSLAYSEDKGEQTQQPDFTKGDVIPKNAMHDWNLGATGMRGWMYCDKLVTSVARQISVTKVEANSPADGVIAVGDLILGVGGKEFSVDPRTELGQALTAAETEAGGGKLVLTRWRAGKTDEVTLKLPVLGSYSATAPFDCPKSKRILEHSSKSLAARMAAPNYGNRIDSIPRSLNALGLLAVGDAGHLPLLKQEAQWAADYSTDGYKTWQYGYVMTFLAEYIAATGDTSVLPGLRRLALESAEGQSAVGSWGHSFAKPDGRLGGYGMMNSPGVPLTISLVLAREAGVRDPKIDLAIERSARLLRFYIGKGAVPYGDHHPWIENHEDNGKCGMASVLFHLLDEPKGTEFFSRMSLASHGAERDTGHTGNFFNMVWAMPGVAHAGPHATGAWMQEFGAWYFDFARRWDGSFVHQGPPEPGHDSYAGWDCSGAYLLAYAIPLKKLYLTGKKSAAIPQFDRAAANAVVADGRGWNNRDRNSFYDGLSDEQLLERLRNWSPVVRERAAMAWGRRKTATATPLIEMLAAPGLEARYGACQGLIFLRGRAAPAVDALQSTLNAPDLWLRIKAAEALAAIGAPARKTVPRLLEMLAQLDEKNDPRGMQQRYLSFALFDRGGMLGRSLDGVDRPSLYKAVRAGLKNQDGRARGSFSSVYRHLSLDEIEPLLPAIHEAIVQPAPSGEMFADEIRVEGLRVLAQHHVEDGMSALVKYTRDQNPWSSENRTPEIMKILITYGSHGKAIIPDLERIANYFEKEEKDFPKNLGLRKANSVRDTIKAIESSTDTPPLIKLKLKSGMDSVERETRDISGWKVHIAKKLLETEADDTARALAGLKKMLDEIVRVVPAPAVAELKKVPLYFSTAYQPGRSGAEFHPGVEWLRENGRDPVMVRGVEFSGVHDFEAEMRRMPNFALHELAHAFHHRVLPDGFDNAEIKAAYERAKSSGSYERVERTRGDGKPNTRERAYAITNAMEYFAETTEAYFARNDFFPFNNDELLKHDPEMHALLGKLWGVTVAQPLPESTQWLTYPGGNGPGKGKHIVLIAAEQEYRSEQSMPMMAKVLSTHHGFNCTVLFGVNERGEVDPTLPVYPEKGKEAEFKEHHIPGLKHLASADLVIFFTRLLTLPQSELEQIVKYVDSGKPIIALRTANHGFRVPLPYKIEGKQVRWGEDILGGTFLNHHGRWHADSTRGFFDKDQTQHPILTGVTDIWGDSDVYRTYKEGTSLPPGCTPLVWGQPLMGRKPDDPPNEKLEPLPVAWVKPWQTSSGKTARVFHSTMGSGTDLKNPGLRRLVINAVYWGIGMESSISATSSVEIVGSYQPLESGFNYDQLGLKPRPVSFYR